MPRLSVDLQVRRARGLLIAAAIVALGLTEAMPVVAAMAPIQRTHASRLDTHHRHTPTPRLRTGGPVADRAGAAFARGGSVRGAAATINPSQVIGGAWSFLGPQPIANDYGNDSGRVTSLSVDPTSSAVAYAGTAGGGVWKTTDAGATWTPLTDGQSTLAIGAVAVDPNNHSTVYAGTGEANRSIDSQAGAGILKSTDGGATWSTYGAPQLGGHYVDAIAVDRTNSARVLVASSAGLFVSLDGGQTYAQDSSLLSLSPTSASYVPRVDSLIQDPDPAHAQDWYAAVDERCGDSGFIAASTDGGNTWAQAIRASSIAGIPRVTRFAMGEGPGGVIYALLASCANSALHFAEGQLVGLLKSTNFGSTWVLNKSMPDPFSVSGETQGWYDITVGVDPTNAGRAVFGGVTLLSTTDGGTTFTDIAKPYSGGPVHPDFHAIAFTGSNAFFTGNDGGVWKTADLGGSGGSADWTNLNSTLGITTFYGGSAIDASHMIGGAQDTGTLGLVPGGPTPPAWSHLAAGDGGYTAMLSGSTTYYGEQALGAIFRADYTKPGLLTSAGPCAVASDPACGEPTTQATPFVVDPANPSILFTAGTHLYRSTTGGVPAGAGGWAQISGDLTTGTTIFIDGDYVSAMAISPDGSVLAVGTAAGRLWFVANPATNPTFTEVTAQIPAFDPSRFTGNPWVTSVSMPQCTGLPCVMLVALGATGVGRVWEIGSSGPNPNNITNNLDGLIPNAIISSVLWTTDGTVNGVYVGTDAGVFACFLCSSGTQSWLAIGTGLPNSRVDQISLTSNGADLVAWTHGRGAWLLPRVASSTVSPTTIDFAGVTVGETSAPEFTTVRNNGLLSGQLSSATISGPNGPDFTQINQWNCAFGPVVSGPTPFPLYPGTTCQVNVTFSPSTVNPESATLAIATSIAPVATVSLTGSPIAPSVALSATTMTYLTTTVGETNVLNQGRITITNNGPGNLDVRGYQISGPNAGDFFYTNDTCSGMSVKPGQSCRVDVPFKPMGPGTRTATFGILDNAPGSPQTVALSGTAVQPSITISPASLAFGPQNAGTTSAPLSVTITNNGPGDFVMTASGFPSYGPSITGPNAADFTLNIGNCNLAVVQGQSCTMTVQFSPVGGATANRTATLNLTDNASGSPQQVAISGGATSPAVTLSPTSLDFGGEALGTTSATQLITLTNAGTGALTLAGAFNVTPTPPFAIVRGAGTCGTAPLPAGGSCTVGIQFSPTVAGNNSGAFSVTGNAGSVSQAALTGTGLAPAIQAPASVQFGNVQWPQSATQVITITNSGSANLVLGQLTVVTQSGPVGDFAIAAALDTCSGRTVAVNASCTTTIVFTPTNLSNPPLTELARLQIPDNVANQALTTVQLSGTGVSPSLTLTPYTVDFQTVPVSTTSTMTVMVSNAILGSPGSANLSITGINIAGANASDFTVMTQNCIGVQIMPGGTCTVTVAFTPSAAGTRTATLNFVSNKYCCRDYADLVGAGGWQDLGGVLTSDATAVSPSAGQMTVFARSSDGAIWYRSWSSGSWSGWQTLGGRLTADPDAVTVGSSTIMVFARGTDNAVWYRTFDGTTWSGWQSIGGVLLSAPAATSSSATHVDLFAQGQDHGLWVRSWDQGTWGGWYSLGGYIVGPPVVVPSSTTRLDVFVRGGDNGLWQRGWNSGSWSAWVTAGGRMASNPAVVSAAAGTFDALVQGQDNALWSNHYDGTKWTGWVSHGGVVGQPTAASCAAGRVDVFVVGQDAAVWQLSNIGGNWSSWASDGGQIAAPPGLVCRSGSGVVDVFGLGTNAELWHVGVA
jgi:hypothetical protein